MASKRRRPRQKRQSQFFVKKGRVQWLNVLNVCVDVIGEGWFVNNTWQSKTTTTTAPVTSHTVFIKRLAPEAQRLNKKYHVMTSITLSQAILESDWGQSTNATENNNLFGVKAYGTQSGKLMTTQEYYDGAYHTVKRRFRVYTSWHDSLVDHAEKLAYGTTWDSQHYAAVIQAKDYQTAAKALQTAGYATDPSYAQKLINIIQKYHLQRYDSK